MNSPWHLYKKCFVVSLHVILHLSRMRRNVNRKVYKDRQNVSTTPRAEPLPGSISLHPCVDVISRF